MRQILHITASARGEASVSRGLGERLAQNLAARIDGEILRRDLNTGIPFVTEEMIEGFYTPDEQRTPAQERALTLSDSLVDELLGADILVLSVPVYNFAVPASFKAWADLVARVGVTFRYTENGPEGLVPDKKTYLVTASGGTPIGSEIDYMSPWVKFFLAFLGITDVEVIAADGVMGEDGPAKIAAAHDRVAAVA